VPGLDRIGPQRRWVIAAAAAAVVLVAGLLVAVAAFGSDDEPETVASTVDVAVVPRIVGLRVSGATAALRRAGLAGVVERKASARAKGIVIATKPKAGSRVESGVAILVVVSKGRPAPGRTTTDEPPPPPPPPPTVPTETRETTEPTGTQGPSDTVIVEPEPALSEVPGVLEVGFVDSARMVEDRGFVAETYPAPSKKPRGTVIRQEPAPGTPLARGRTVRLYVALGKGSRGAIELPDFTGFPERQARELAERAGFTVRMADRAAPSRELVGEVLRQRPAAGGRVPVLTQVTLYVGR
jgi:beta-lactam-binding protein with PASTA domain